jgi:hypothetical protein
MLKGLRRLNRYENRIFKIAKDGGKFVRLSQIGFSRKTKNNFRFPIYCLEIGKKSAIEKNPVGIVAGVHGLETIGVRVTLDFLEFLVSEKHKDFFPEIFKGDVGIVCLPMINPGGIVETSRSNPAGIDLMRNSGIEAVKAPLFFGGHKISPKLPYYRGNHLEPESRVVNRFVNQYFFNNKTAIMPLIDIHSGFGAVDHVWWPFAFTHEACADEPIYKKMALYLKEKNLHKEYEYGPQSETYTTHGDLWDKFYLEYRNLIEIRKSKSRFLPWTLEIGTWSDILDYPSKLNRRRGIFNPAKENKQAVIKNYRLFLRDFVRLSCVKPAYWLK